MLCKNIKQEEGLGSARVATMKNGQKDLNEMQRLEGSEKVSHVDTFPSE